MPCNLFAASRSGWQLHRDSVTETERDDVKVRVGTIIAAFAAVACGESALATEAVGRAIEVSNGKELAAAVKSVKDIRAANRDVPVEILLASGDYDVPNEIVMRGDRGFVSSEVAPVTIRAASGAKPRLFGGREVKGWKRTSFNGRDDVWVADVSALKLKWQLPLFYYDGVSMTLCRRPNADPGRPYSGKGRPRSRSG